ncbi:MAG: class I SAM-dependent methyltransferase [Myxococcota bacterium]
MDADPTPISMTAKLAAYYRQFTDIPFAADIARGIGADAAFDALAREHGLDREKLTFYAPMFEARYKSLTALIRASGARQVLELASGYSLRGFDLTQHEGFRYVEADLAGVTATKRALLADLQRQHGLSPRPDHVVAVADVRDLAQVRAAAAPLDRGAPVVVLCEGLIPYLSREETERLATNVRAVLSEFADGCWMTPDFLFRSEARDLPPERIRLREVVAGVTQRQFDRSAFEDGDDLAAFLGRLGFDVAVRRQVDETPSFSSIAALGLDPALIERLRPALRVWTMTLR